MKKPDIIYVHRGLHLGMLTTTVIKVGAPDEEEYIRKNALLEWLNEAIIAANNDGICAGFKIVLNKIKSL